jgi:hypothetical protein
MLNTLVFLMAAMPQAVPEPAAPLPEPEPVPLFRTEDLVKQIAREVIAQQALEAAATRPDTAGVISAVPNNDKYAVFAVKFAQARTPDCLGPDGLKFNPPVIANIRGFGPIMVSGIYAIPWVVAAKLKGKCN